MNVYPAKYLSSGDWVKMSWQYVSSPSVYDWIGVYSPPLNDIYVINPTLQAPIKVQVYILANAMICTQRMYAAHMTGSYVMLIHAVCQCV